MTSSPDPRRDDSLQSIHQERKKLTADELIAVFVAFLSIGGIFAWAVTQKEQAFNLESLSSPLFTSLTPTQAPRPLGTSTPTPMIESGISASQNSAPSQLSDRTPSLPNQAPYPTVLLLPSTSPSPSIVASPSPPLPTLTPAPTVAPPPLASVPNANSPTGFSDVPADYWAAAYIAELARRNILGGFPNGTFQPNKPITRAEFAGIVSKAFDKPKGRQPFPFRDLEENYWAKRAIDEAVQTGFLNGYPGGVFQPDQEIPLVQLQAALVTGLKLQPQSRPSQVLSRFEDASEVPKWAQDKAAAAVESGIVTNYPNPRKLDPNRISTRADAAALIYQAMVKEGRVSPSIR
jgi:hypothetical protein